MADHERRGAGDGRGLGLGHRAQIEQVARPGPVAAMPEFLGDDLGAGFNLDGAPGIGNGLPGFGGKG